MMAATASFEGENGFVIPEWPPSDGQSQTQPDHGGGGGRMWPESQLNSIHKEIGASSPSVPSPPRPQADRPR